MTECYHCRNGTHTIPGQFAGAPEGICLKCHVAACRGHAGRDPNYPRWVCVICDSTLLTASAIQASGSTTILTQLVSSAILRDKGLYQNLEAFIEARPDMRWILVDAEKTLYLIERHIGNRASVAIWEPLTQEGRLMIAAAIALVRRLKIEPQELVEVLRIFIEDINDD